MSRLRISAISYLNTAPLMWDFEHGSLGEQFDITYTVPSVCAETIRQGNADIGLIPAVTYTTIPNLLIIPGLCIGTRDKVASILLVSKVPLDEIRTVAADSSSRTSVALCRVIFRKWHGGKREFTTMKPDLKSMLAECDAALVIGDPALTLETEGLYRYDLAEEWHRRTGKPFVFAFWVVREEAARPGLAQIFQRSCENGLQHLDEIAAEWAPKVGISEDAVKKYLTENIDYSFDREKIESLQLFLDYAVETKVLTGEIPRLRFAADDERRGSGGSMLSAAVSVL